MINAVTGDINLASSTPGSYTITYTFTNGTCTNSASAAITINALPVAIINYAGSPYCGVSGTVSVTQTGQGGGTYVSTAGLSLNSSNGDIDLGTSVAGTYVVTYNFSNGTCGNSTTASVTINSLPPATISYVGNPYCSTGIALVTQTGQNGGTYSSTAGLSLNSATGSVNLSTSILGTYTVTYSFGNGTCSNTTTASITINAQPTVVITNPAAVCAPATVDLTAAAVTAGSTAGLTYTYYTDAAGTIVLAAPNAVAASGTYYIKGTTASGCFDIKPVVVTINPLPVATIAYTGTPYCTTGMAFVTLTGAGGGTFTSSLGLSLNAVTGDINLAASAPGFYIVTYTFSNGTCSNTTTTTVAIKNPTLVINNPAGACSPATIDLTNPAITAGSQGGLTYNYYQDPAGTIPVVNPTAVGISGTYFVKGTDLITGCSTPIDPVVVNIFAKPVISASASATDICKGSVVTLTASSPGNTIDWPGVGAGNVVTATPLDSTIYLAIATSPNGCMDTAVVNVGVIPFKITLTANPDPVLAGTNTTLTTNANMAYNILSWSPSVFFANQTALTQNIIVKDTSKSFTVIGQSSGGCMDTATLFVTVDPNLKDFFIPNAFSPNGDGNNDVFKVYGSSVRDLTLRVYNQWGELIFESKNAQTGWDGTWKGRPQAVGVYVYVAQVTFFNNVSIKRKGTVELIR